MNRREVGLAKAAWSRCERQFDDAERHLEALVNEGVKKDSKALRGQYLKEIYTIVYNLLSRQTPDRLIEDFCRMIATTGNNPEQRNLFNLAIQAFENHFEIGISKQSRSEYANALTYAWSYSIPQLLVWGFILQEGGVKAVNKKFRAGDPPSWVTTQLPWDRFDPLS